MPLKPVRITANVPAEVRGLIAQRVREEKYPSTSAYIIGLILFDLYSRRPHWLTGTLMREPQWMRDEVIAELARDFATGGKGGQGWFEKRIDELLEERRSRKESSGA